MYPNVRSGDLLHIRSCPMNETRKGDIALCRDHSGLLFAHRIVASGRAEGRPYICTRADTRHQGEDAPVFADNLLGVVAAIERRGKLLSPEKRDYNWATLLSLRSLLFVREIPLHLSRFLPRIQKNVLYRRIAETVLRLWLRPENWFYMVRIPFRPDHSRNTFQAFPVERFDLGSLDRQGRCPDKWILALHLNRGTKAAALADYTLLPNEGSPPASWQLTGVQIRLRFRGCGLRRELMSRAEDIMTNSDTGSKIPER